eukprot:29814-Alexandrium_andersonii.AAC.1
MHKAVHVQPRPKASCKQKRAEQAKGPPRQEVRTAACTAARRQRRAGAHAERGREAECARQ